MDALPFDLFFDRDDLFVMKVVLWNFPNYL